MTDDTQHETPARCRCGHGYDAHIGGGRCGLDCDCGAYIAAPPEQDEERGRLKKRSVDDQLRYLAGRCRDNGLPGIAAGVHHVRDRLRSEVQGESEPRCPKCGSGDINAKWYDQCDAVYRRHHECDNTDEHLCRTCRNCGYGWDESVLDATRPQEPEGEDGA